MGPLPPPVGHRELFAVGAAPRATAGEATGGPVALELARPVSTKAVKEERPNEDAQLATLEKM